MDILILSAFVIALEVGQWLTVGRKARKYRDKWEEASLAHGRELALYRDVLRNAEAEIARLKGGAA